MLPDGFPQQKQVVEEQLKVLKSLQITVKTSNNINIEASGSKTQSSGSSKKREKTTSFVPNTQRSEIRNKSGDLTMLEKLQLAAPYNLFFTRIPESPETLKQSNSIKITGILVLSLQDFV